MPCIFFCSKACLIIWVFSVFVLPLLLQLWRVLDFLAEQDMPMCQDLTELKRSALKYIKVMIGLNADRRRAAQPLKLFEEERAR